MLPLCPPSRITSSMRYRSAVSAGGTACPATHSTGSPTRSAALTGQLAGCAGSCGPGNLHLINGLFDAQRSRVPVLAVAAHIPRMEIGSEYFQETHPQELFRECSVYCELVSTPEMAPRILEMAMRAAVEESGVAVVVIPGEIFLHRAA